jgi:acetyl esterase/lipase
VVLLRGGPGGLGFRSYIRTFASELSAAGVLVFSTDMRDLASAGGGWPVAPRDVACAIRFARTQAGAYGGDGASVTLVGHSFGGYVGSIVALDAAEFTGGCLAGGSGRPNAFVGLAGNYLLGASEVAYDFRLFFGGLPADTADARDPFNYATKAPIPVRLVAGTADRTVNPAASRSLEAFLEKQAWNTKLTMVGGASHSGIIGTSASGPVSVGVVLEAIEAARGKP